MSSDNIIPPEDVMLYLVNVHRRLFLRKAFGINLDGTPIPNIEEFNDAPIKTYRFVKTVAQYNEIIRVLTYWGDDKFLVAQPLQLVVAWYLSLRLLNCYLGGWQKRGGFTSEGSTSMPRNGRLTGCESC